MAYELIFNFRDNKHFNSDFMNLIKRYDDKTTFESWLTKSKADENFMPFGLIDDKNNLVACAGVIKTHLCFKNKKYDTIQIGKLFVKDDIKDFEIKKELLNQIVSKFDSVVDAMYIFDDDIRDKTRLDALGFKKAPDKKCIMKWTSTSEDPLTLVVKKINIEDPAEFQSLMDQIKHSSRENEVMTTNGDASVKMYNILKRYPRNVFHIPSMQATIVFTIREGVFNLIGVFSDKAVDMMDLLKVVVPGHIDTVEFGFIPKLKGVELVDKTPEEIANDSAFWIKPISMAYDENLIVAPILSNAK